MTTIEIKRRKGESFESLMRRFRKSMQMSGKVLQVKKKQYRPSHKSDNMQRASTLLKLQRKEKMEYLQKVGKA